MMAVVCAVGVNAELTVGASATLASCRCWLMYVAPRVVPTIATSTTATMAAASAFPLSARRIVESRVGRSELTATPHTAPVRHGVHPWHAALPSFFNTHPLH